VWEWLAGASTPMLPYSHTVCPMAYVSLYRKYRSQSFGEVIGQEHVTKVLQNAIRMGRIAHAYLFCGPRGCGKTSSARLLARALNCQAGDGPTPEPCGACDMCARIRDGAAMDVIEMDAASETGIDDVREKIIENAKYAPGEGRYKVYIIDEVHDLSLKAFDSLLKTIEEPPAHVVFILATTEAHKVPITVRSRCQRMDFRRGSLQDLIDVVKRVLDAEQMEYESEAVTAIARAAEGSFRDSLSLLEQTLAYTDGKLTAQAVHTSIGTIGPEMLDEAVRAIASNDLNAAFLKAGEIVESGKDVKQTLIALQAHLRDLMVAGIAKGPQALPELSAERFAQVREQAGWFSSTQILQMLNVLAEAERDIRFTNQHRLLLERAFWSILPSCLVMKAHSVEAAPASTRPKPASPQKPAPPSSTANAPSPPVTPDNGVSGEVEPPAVESTSMPSTPAAAAQETERVEPQFAAEIDLGGVRRIWPRVLRRVTKEYPSAGAVFTDEVQIVALDGKFVILGFPKEFMLTRADRPRSREIVEKMLCTELGIAGLKVKCQLADLHFEPAGPVSAEPASMTFAAEPPDETVSDRTNGNGAAPVMDAPMEAVVATPPDVTAEEDDFLRLVMAELDGKLVDEED
jgi:DNA polymerase III subunit gamma/tau